MKGTSYFLKRDFLALKMHSSKPVIRGFFLVLFLIISFQSVGQDFFFRQYTIEDGLPTSNVYDIGQDKRGLLWFGTELGLTSFDGQTFRNYTMEDGLPNNTVAEISIDYRDRIWLYTFSDKISYLENGKGKIIEDEILANFRSSYIQNSADSSIWIFRVNNLDKGSGRPSLRIDQKGNMRLMPDYRATNMSRLFDLTDSVQLLANLHNFIYYKDLHATDSIDAGPGISNRYCVEFQNALICPSYNYLDSRYFIYKFNPHSRKKSTLLSGYESMFQDNLLQQVFVDKNENLWLLLADKLLYFIMEGEEVVEVNELLNNKKPSSIFEDDEGSIWVSTEGDGVFQIVSPEIGFLDVNETLSGPLIRSMCTDSTGNIYLGYTNGKIDVLSPDLKLQKTYSVGSARVVDIYLSRDKIYVLTDNTFIRLYKDGNYKVLSRFTQPLKHLNIKDDDIYLFSYNILKQQSKDQDFIELDYPLNYRIYTSHFINDSTLWLGTTTGLYVYDLINESYIGLLHPEIAADVRSIVVQNDSTYWISTMGHGIFQYNISSQKLRSISREDGLPGNLCQDMIYQDGYLWVGTSKGLCRINLRTNQFDSFNSFHGLSSDQLMYLGISGNRLLAANEHGINSIPLEIREQYDPPKFFIESVRVNSQRKEIDDLRELHHKQQNISIDLKGISLKSNGNIQYAYQLMGYDRSWVYSKSGQVNYSGLPPGKYTFTARAKGESTYWSRPVSFSFVIATPWWKKGWFWILLGLALVSIIGLIVLGIYRGIKRSIQIRKKLVESQLTALRAQMNPHFMFNALSSIQEFINLNNPRKANDYLAHFASLIRKILENSGKEFIPFPEELEMLNLYLKLEKMRLYGELDYDIEVAPKIRPENLRIPSMVIQPYVENAVKHGLFHKKGPKKLQVQFEILDEDHLLCTVIDNGIGRSRSGEIQANAQKRRKSYGTRVTQQRLALLNRYGAAPLSVEFEDLESPSGTIVRLIIPVKHS
ncbi:MAG: hypothetical protein GYB31_08425 [Bacteroidetes bacterium]|nr:hypothetical protein [Bacteroidota bacterium]